MYNSVNELLVGYVILGRRSNWSLDVASYTAESHIYLVPDEIWHRLHGLDYLQGAQVNICDEVPRLQTYWLLARSRYNFLWLLNWLFPAIFYSWHHIIRNIKYDACVPVLMRVDDKPSKWWLKMRTITVISELVWISGWQGKG